MTCHLKYGIPSSEIPFVYCRSIAIISQFTYKEDNITPNFGHMSGPCKL